MVTATAFLLSGAFMFRVCLGGIPRRLGLPGNLIVPAAWILPSAVLLVGRRWFLAKALSEQWLVGLQVVRATGGVFLIEMARGTLPGIFAYPAGVGDLLVAVVAMVVLLRWRRARSFRAVPCSS